MILRAAYRYSHVSDSPASLGMTTMIQGCIVMRSGALIRQQLVLALASLTISGVGREAAVPNTPRPQAANPAV